MAHPSFFTYIFLSLFLVAMAVDTMSVGGHQSAVYYDYRPASRVRYVSSKARLKSGRGETRKVDVVTDFFSSDSPYKRKLTTIHKPAHTDLTCNNPSLALPLTDVLLPYQPLSPLSSDSLGKIPRLIKNVIPMPPNTLSLEQIREPQSSRNLRLMHKLIAEILRFANYELTNL